MFVTFNGSEMNSETIRNLRKIYELNTLASYILELTDGKSFKIDKDDTLVDEVLNVSSFLDTDYGILNLEAIGSVVESDFYDNGENVGLTKLKYKYVPQDVLYFYGDDQLKIDGVIDALRDYSPSTGSGGSGGDGTDLSDYVKKTTLDSTIADTKTELSTAFGDADAAILQQSKDYTDTQIAGLSGSGGDGGSSSITQADIDAGVQDAKDYADTQIAALNIPSVEGLATSAEVSTALQSAKDYTDDTILDLNIPSIDGLATVDSVNTALQGAKDYTDTAIGNINIPSIEGLATEAFVTDEIDNIVDASLQSATFDQTSRQLDLVKGDSSTISVVIPGVDASNLPIATKSSLGAVQVGSGLNITAGGVIDIDVDNLDLTENISITSLNDAVNKKQEVLILKNHLQFESDNKTLSVVTGTANTNIPTLQLVRNLLDTGNPTIPGNGTASDNGYVSKSYVDGVATEIRTEIGNLGQYLGKFDSESDLNVSVTDATAGDYAFVLTNPDNAELFVYDGTKWDDVIPLNTSLGDYATMDEVNQAIALESNRINTELGDRYTIAEVDAIIAALDIPDIDVSNFVTQEDIDSTVSEAVNNVSQVVIGSVIEIVEGSPVPEGYLVLDGSDLTSDMLSNENIPSAIRTKQKTPDSRVEITYSDTDAEFVTVVKCMYIGK